MIRITDDRNEIRTAIETSSIFATVQHDLAVVLEEAGQIVAIATIDGEDVDEINEQIEDGQWYPTIFDLGVVESSSGYAGQIVRWMQANARQITANDTLDDAVSFWQHFGFVEDGENEDGDPIMTWNNR